MCAGVCAFRFALVATSIPVTGFAQPAAPASNEPAPAGPAQGLPVKDTITLGATAWF